jgi:hypothetical protein
MGFSEGAEFHYTDLIGIYPDDYYIVVDEIGTFPENFSSQPQITVSISEYWSNGTEIPAIVDIFWMWVPIGNWSYVKTLFGFSEPETVNWIDTEEIFGYNNSVDEYVACLTFWKADGVVYEIHHKTTYEYHFLRTDVSPSTTTSPETTSSTSATSSTEPTEGPTGPSLFDRPEILVISIAGVGVILIVAVVIIKKR